MRLSPKCDLAKIEKLREGMPRIDEFTVAEFYGVNFESE